MAAQEPLLGEPDRRPGGPPSLRLANSHLRLSELGKGELEWAQEALQEPPARPGNAGMWCRRTGILCVVLLVAAAASAAVSVGRAGWQCMQAEAAAAAAERWPTFLVLGDWGRRGGYNQTTVAAAMARKAAAMGGIDFVVSTGDNFYPSGLTSPYDPQFDESFRLVYHQKGLQVPWHAVLGNHDHGQFDDPDSPDAAAAAGSGAAAADGGGGGGGDPPPKPRCGPWDWDCTFSPLHELDARLGAFDARWHCERAYSVVLAGGRAELFLTDTTPLMREYAGVPWRSNPGGLDEQSPLGQLRELEARLARSRAAWKLVVGHHPIRTNHRESLHEAPELVAGFEPLFKQHGVQAYFAGHDHNLQLLHRPGTGYHHITSGAGSRLSTPSFRGSRDSLFQAAVNGFVAVRLRPSTLRVEYMGTDSDEPLFSIDIPLRE